MISIIRLNYSSFLRYRITLKTGKIQHIEELSFQEIKVISEPVVQSVNIQRLFPNLMMLKTPNSFNKRTIELLSKMSLTTLIQMLPKSSNLIGNNLIKFKYKGLFYVSDGSCYSDYSPKYDNSVQYTDSQSAYMFNEKAVVVHPDLIPLLICLITQELQEDTPLLIDQQQEDILEKYFAKKHYQLIKDLLRFTIWVTSQESNTKKSIIIPIFLVYTIVSNMKCTHNEIVEMVSEITNGVAGLSVVMLILRDTNIIHDGLYDGEDSIYTLPNK